MVGEIILIPAPSSPSRRPHRTCGPGARVGPAAPAPEGALSTPTRVDMLLTHDFLYFLIENFSPTPDRRPQKSVEKLGYRTKGWGNNN